MAASEAADAAQAAALMAAAEAADVAQAAALMAASEAADAAQAAALMAAAEAADAAQAAALAAAAMMAEEDQAAAVAAAEAVHAAALEAAATAAAADKMTALEDAATAAAADKMTALEDAATAAAADKMTALEDAATAAAADKMTALEDAATAAAADKMTALEDAATAAAADKMTALEDAATAAAADKKKALEDAAAEAEIAKAAAVNAAVTAALSEDAATRALGAYRNAKTDLDIAESAYEQDPTVANAKAYMDAATDAYMKAQAAHTAAQDGNTEQMTQAGQAVTDTGNAVTSAGTAVNEANRVAGITADALQVAMAILASPETIADVVDVPEFGVTATRTDAAGVKITVSDLGADRTVDPPDEPPLTQDDEELKASTSLAPQISSKWSSSRHERTDDDEGVKEVVTVYSDIKAAGDEPYDSYYTVADRAAVEGSVDVDSRELMIDEEMVAANADLFQSANFPRVGAQVATYPANDPATDVNEGLGRTFGGRFNGVLGEYSCTADAPAVCRATAGNDGKLLSLDGEWTFTPVAGVHKVLGVTPDPDQLHFGYWLKTTAGEDDNPTSYAFKPFYGGTDVYTMGNQVVEEAEYAGNAAGHYTLKRLRSSGATSNAVTGEFQATVNLTAYFGGDEVRASDHFSIEGEVTGFGDGRADSQANAELGAWSVTLKQETFDEDSDGSFTDGVTTATGKDGTWSAQFFGPDLAVQGVTPQPTGVAGAFDAHFANGHAAGAYGAQIQKK